MLSQLRQKRYDMYGRSAAFFVPLSARLPVNNHQECVPLFLRSVSSACHLPAAQQSVYEGNERHEMGIKAGQLICDRESGKESSLTRSHMREEQSQERQPPPIKT